MYKYLLVLTILSTTGSLYCQDSTNNDNCRKYRMSYSVVNKNNRKVILYEMGGRPISSKQFIERLNSFPESANEYRQAKKSTLIVMASSLPLFIVGGVYARQQKVPREVIFLSGGLLGSALSIPMVKSIEHIENSLIIYNQKVCGTPVVF